MLDNNKATVAKIKTIFVTDFELIFFPKIFINYNNISDYATINF